MESVQPVYESVQDLVDAQTSAVASGSFEPHMATVRRTFFKLQNLPLFFEIPHRSSNILSNVCTSESIQSREKHFG
jgi:hypothetical protein